MGDGSKKDRDDLIREQAWLVHYCHKLKQTESGIEYEWIDKEFEKRFNDIKTILTNRG